MAARDGETPGTFEARLVRLERTAERLEPMIPVLEEVVGDRIYSDRRRADHGRRLKTWQIRLAIIAGVVTTASVIAGSVASLLHALGIGG